MNKSFWLFGIGFVLTLAGSSSVWGLDKCSCKHWDRLKLELQNAVTVQRNFREVIPKLRRQRDLQLSDQELKEFSEGDARKGFVIDRKYKGPVAFAYRAVGEGMDPELWNKHSTGQLCRMTDKAAGLLNKAVAATACLGIGEAVRAHEEVHHQTCLRMGYSAFYNRHSADVAEDEVKAYGVQIRRLREEIVKVLEKSNARVELEVDMHFRMSVANPFYTAIDQKERGRVPLKGSASLEDAIRLDGEGEHTKDGTVNGVCRFVGFPFTLPARATLETDGQEAQIRYTVSGTHPSITMECMPVTWMGGVWDRTSATSMPFPAAPAGALPVFNLPLENGAEAKIEVPQGLRTVTGEGKIRLIFCENK